MAIQISTVKPGYLVSLKTNVRGGVSYQRIDTEAEHETASGELIAEWQTKRITHAPEEHAEAIVARGKASNLIRACCAPTSFGLLCPAERIEDLQGAIGDAQKIAQAFNSKATQTRVDVFVLVGRIAADDAEAQRAINAELRDLLDDMRNGISNVDPKAIREAANKARAIDSMLAPEVSSQVAEAIAQARRAARAIVKRVQKSGELASKVIEEISVDKIKTARFAFLDVDSNGNVDVQSEKPAARGLDLEPAQVSAKEKKAPARKLPFEIEIDN